MGIAFLFLLQIGNGGFRKSSFLNNFEVLENTLTKYFSFPKKNEFLQFFPKSICLKTLY